MDVSSDGIHFVRFPAHTEVPFANQIGGFEFIDCRYLNNFAGKYEQGFGTPFDLSDLPQDSLLNLDYKGEKIETVDRLNQAIKDESWMSKNKDFVTLT